MGRYEHMPLSPRIVLKIELVRQNVKNEVT